MICSVTRIFFECVPNSFFVGGNSDILNESLGVGLHEGYPLWDLDYANVGAAVPDGCIQDGDTVIYLLVSMHLRNRETTTSFAVSNRFSYKKNENTIMNICLKMLNTAFNIYLTISTHPQNHRKKIFKLP